jgi:site-specific DNA recombinase
MATSALTKAALASKREQGEYVGGHVPYGWDVADDGVRLVANYEEQAAIGYAHELRATGLSLRAVGARLTERGMVPKRGQKWHASSVRCLLAAPRAKNGPYCGAEMDKQFLDLQ